MGASTYDRLLQRAGNILSSRPHSRGELQQKLGRHAEEGTIRQVLDRLQELGLLNDEEYAHNMAFRRMARDGWAPDRTFQFLVRRLVDSGLARRTVDRVLNSIGEEVVLERLLQRRMRTARWMNNPKQVFRLYASLLASGFATEATREVLKRHIPAAIWQQLEDGD